MQYTSRDVRTIVGVPASTINRLVAAGLITPSQGPRGAHLFGFRDLVLVRAAKQLADARISPRRISASLRKLRKELPDDLPLAGLRITAVGANVVVAQGASQWRAEDGQYLLAFDVAEHHGHLTFADARSDTPESGEAWFDEGRRLEDSDVARALEAYSRAVRVDACLSGAYVNWGRLLHEAGRLDEAQKIYDDGARACPGDATLLYNFALLREDQARLPEAIGLYERALTIDPMLTDAHYNLGLLYESLGHAREALRHFNAYRRSATITDGQSR